MIIELLIIFFSLLIFLRVINIIFPITEGKKNKKKKKKGIGGMFKNIKKGTKNMFSGNDDGGSHQLDQSGYNILTDKIDNQGTRINELNSEIDNRIKEAKTKEDENLVRLKDMEEDVDFLMRYTTAENFFEKEGRKKKNKK